MAMSGKLKHMRHIKRGTPHVHACPCCSEWRINPAVCTDERCDIVGVYDDCPSITEGERFPLGGRYAACDACAKRGDDRRSIDALQVFGEAIATIARAQMVARAGAGRVIATVLRGRILELRSANGWMFLMEYAYIPRAQGGLGPSPGPHMLQKTRGNPEDIAAEAVAALIEECER
jgi:hypothetical protein